MREDLERLVAGALGRSSTEDGLLWDLAFVLAEGTGAQSCELLTDDGDTLLMRASNSSTEKNNRLRITKGIGPIGTVAVNKTASYTGVQRKVSHAVIPLLSGNSLIGVMSLRFDPAQSFTASARARLETLGCIVGEMVKGGRNFEASNRQTRIGALSEVSRVIAKSPYVEEILQLLVNFTAQQFEYKVCTVRLLDESRGELVLRATQAPAKAYQRKRAIKFGESIAGKAVAENRPILVRDVQNDPDYVGHDLAAEIGLRSMACVPMVIGDRPIGVMSCYTTEIREFGSDEIRALETLAKQAAASIEHAKMQVRNTLMQEMHHRVKNNLQQIASLLRLQMRHGSYKSLEEALTDCITRILSIASVHDLLSREDLDHVSIRSIGQSLVQYQDKSLIPASKSISFLVRGDDVYLNMNQATQLALVLNELISNAVEHGFKQTDAGDIHITVEEDSETSEVSLWVSNNGDPLEPGFDPAKSSSLGLNIVNSLARSLGGSFKMEDILGWTVAEVKFFRYGGE